MDWIEIRLNTIETVKNFVKVASSFISDIDVMTDQAQVDGKSIIGVFSLCLLDKICTRIKSDDPEECERFSKEMEGFE